MLFKIFFSDSCCIVIKVLQRTTCRYKDFLRVLGMCLSHNWYNLFAYCILYGTWVLNGCVDHIICTTNWFIQISLEFRKWLVYKDLILKDTKVLSKLPWLSRKQSTIFISSNSNLVILTFSILSPNTEALVCVVFVFRNELNKGFLYFFLKSLFCKARHSVNSLVSVIEVNSSLHVIKHLSTLYKNFSTESILE